MRANNFTFRGKGSRNYGGDWGRSVSSDEVGEGSRGARRETLSKNTEYEGVKKQGVIFVSTNGSGGVSVEKCSVSSCPVVEESLSDQIQGVMVSKEEQIARNLSRIESVSVVNKEVPEGILNVFLYERKVSSGISCNDGNVLVMEDNLVLKRDGCSGFEISDDRSSVGKVKGDDCFEFVAVGGVSSFSSEGDLSSIQSVESNKGG
ncbi:hypothetical protein ACOSP7_018066 [Xanthoceras sorbifolium]